MLHLLAIIVAVWLIVDLLIVAVLATARPARERHERKWWR